LIPREIIPHHRIQNARKVKDWIASMLVPAESWYVANPNLTVVETRRLQRIGKAVDEMDEMPDKIGN
jgi:hypothetical protein